MDPSPTTAYESANDGTLYLPNGIASTSVSFFSSSQDEHSPRMRAHKGNRPSLPQSKHCPLCPAKFTRITHLNRHLRTHYGESGTLLLFTGAPVAGLPLVNSMPSKSPASGISTGDSSNNTYSFTCVDGGHVAYNFPVAVPPGTSHIPPPIESREKREPQDRVDQYQKSKKKFSCKDCGAEFVQRQGLNRHRLEKHEPNLCRYCDAEWGRPYEYRNHLEKHHPDVDRDTELDKPAGSRRRPAIFVRRRSQQVSLPAIEHCRRGHSGIRPYPRAVVKPSPFTATLPPPESTQPIMTSNGIPEGEHTQTTLMAPLGAPQDEYTVWPVWGSPILPRNGTYSHPYFDF